MRTVPVLIVGGGLVGLTASIGLAHNGIDHLLVERHEGTAIQPKARRFDFRSMEIFRAYDLESQIVAAAARLATYQGMRTGRTLAESEPVEIGVGPQKIDYEQMFACTPCLSTLVPQDVLEPLLRKASEDRGADIRFATELVELTQDSDGVTATIRDRLTGQADRVRAEYVIAADGARSPVREALGIRRIGRGSLGRAVNVHFAADLSEQIGGREFNLCQLTHEDCEGALASIDGSTRWLFMGHDLELDPAVWQGRLAIGLGFDVDVEVLSVLEWEPAMRVAETYARGRVFLAGDAAHVMPPFAAKGANTGIQDVHNLTWKLAEVLAGKADGDLLGSYDLERRPAGYVAAEQSSLRSGLDIFAGPGSGGDERRRPELYDPLALTVGFQYTQGAIIPDRSAPAPTDRLELVGRPGTRVPHAYLDDTGTRSTIDLARRGFAVLTGIGGDGRWREAATSRHLPYAEVEAEPFEPDTALLVRPDAIVAARLETTDLRSPKTLLDKAFHDILGTRLEAGTPA